MDSNDGEKRESVSETEGTVEGLSDFVTKLERSVAEDMACKLLADPRLWRSGWDHEKTPLTGGSD